jgi:hypothetical protein
MLNLNIKITDIVQPFYFVGVSSTTSVNAVPLIQFTTPDTFVTIITGFSLKSAVDIMLECGGAPAPDVTYRSDIIVNDESIFTQLKGLTFGQELKHMPEYHVDNTLIPLRPNATVKFGFWGAVGIAYAPVYLPNYEAQVWGYTTRINYQNTVVLP